MMSWILRETLLWRFAWSTESLTKQLYWLEKEFVMGTLLIKDANIRILHMQ